MFFTIVVIIIVMSASQNLVGGHRDGRPGPCPAPNLQCDLGHSVIPPPPKPEGSASSVSEGLSEGHLGSFQLSPSEGPGSPTFLTASEGLSTH